MLALVGCTGSRTAAPPTTTTTTPSTTSTTSTTPVALDADVAALPDGHGAKIAVVVDDAGGVDTYLADYLELPVTISIIPLAPHAHDDDAAAHAAGRDVMLHIPLANRSGKGGTPPGGLSVGTPADEVDRFVADAVTRVPHAVGANNHEGPLGSSTPALMTALLTSLKQRNLFFMDSVTSQRTVGFALATQMGMPPRINNVFLDHFETDADSRRALLDLARIAATSPTKGAIGICHVFHPYVARALNALRAQLASKGYVFAPISDVTDAPAPTGLDKGVRTSLT